MGLRIHDDRRAFLALAEPFYGADTFRHTIALTVMARVLRAAEPSPAIMATLHDDDELVGVALRTPPWPVIVSGLPVDPELVDGFVTQWLDAGLDFPGVSGPVENARAVADGWTRLTGGTTKVTLASRLFRLGELTPPVAAGRARVATGDDIEVLVTWWDDFAVEVLGFQREHDDGSAAIRRMVDNGDTALLWEDGGRPVAWAMASAPIGGMSRVGPVYTPPSHRGHGYGSAVTAAVSQRARDAGAGDVVLFTDLANPTSNSIYRKIGFRPVYDSTELAFTRLPSTS
jgi:GNAT superfamily N-acetyltransferase